MNMTSFISKLRKQVSFHRHDADNDVSSIGGMPLPLAEEDRELDGFLLVGEKISCSQITQVSDGLPPYNAAVEADPLQQRVCLPQEPQRTSAVQSFAVPQTAVTDIPMDLHPSMKTQRHIESIFQDVDLTPKSFNWAKYSYDFTNEQLFLRDVEYKDE